MTLTPLVSLGLQLRSVVALSNHLRPAERSLPLAALGALPSLRLLDLRFNKKLTKSRTLIAQVLYHL